MALVPVPLVLVADTVPLPAIVSKPVLATDTVAPEPELVSVPLFVKVPVLALKVIERFEATVVLDAMLIPLADVVEVVAVTLPPLRFNVPPPANDRLKVLVGV